jgi:AGZA family xanthine/uracil permease-like MFS transporter
MSGFVKNINVRIGALLIASIIGVILGLTKSVSSFIDFAGTTVIFGMMAGVGLILSEVSIKLAKQELRIGIISIIGAIAIWIISHDVVYTIAVSVLLSSLDFCIFQKRAVDMSALFNNVEKHVETSNWRIWKKEYWKEFVIVKPKFNLATIFAALGFISLNIGSNISFGNITSNIAGVEPRTDVLTIINSIADIPSIMFGGMPIEAIISGTAAAPYPLYAGILMMLVTAILLLTGMITKIAKYIPSQSISGFLLIIGFALTLVPNLHLVAQSNNPMEGIVAASVTMITKNAFLGIIAGITVKIMGSLIWIV